MEYEKTKWELNNLNKIIKEFNCIWKKKNEEFNKIKINEPKNEINNNQKIQSNNTVNIQNINNIVGKNQNISEIKGKKKYFWINYWL